MRLKVFLALAVTAAASVGLAATAWADGMAGSYYATPSWDQQLPVSTRFSVLSWMDANYPAGGAAVLDRETGLVWERSPTLHANSLARPAAPIQCARARTGGRQGWRLPRFEELLTLADLSNSANLQIHLPSGHPFQNINLGINYWAANVDPPQTNSADPAYIVFFDPAGSTPGGQLNNVSASASTPIAGVWCVRGGAGSSE